MPHVKIDIDEVDRIVCQTIRDTLVNGYYLDWSDSDKIKEALVIAHNWYCIPQDWLEPEDFE